MSIGLNDPLSYVRSVLTKFGQGVFLAYSEGGTTLSTTVDNHLAPTEVLDLNSWYVNGVFTPKQPGYYILFGSAYLHGDGGFTELGHTFMLRIKKNADAETKAMASMRAYIPVTVVDIVEANGTTDYFRLTATTTGGTPNVYRYMFGGVFISYNNP
jgi:hypothetical protein